LDRIAGAAVSVLHLNCHLIPVFLGISDVAGNHAMLIDRESRRCPRQLKDQLVAATELHSFLILARIRKAPISAASLPERPVVPSIRGSAGCADWRRPDIPAQIVADQNLVKRTHTYGVLAPDNAMTGQLSASLLTHTGIRSGEQPSFTKHTMDVTLRPGESITWAWNPTGPSRLSASLR
jgi:hypothetical protein